jgi:2-succinyl-5-enolpyruvyl-6-hydroxy-3-cyclohexene-1-carboxylate synthase
VLEQPADLPALRVALDAALGRSATTIVHVRTDRAANVALHRACWAAVRAAADGVATPG